MKKARKANLLGGAKPRQKLAKATVGARLFELVEQAQRNGWSAEERLVAEIKKREKGLRRRESNRPYA